MGEPYDSGTAKRHILRIIGGPGRTTFGKHASREMEKDGMGSPDVINILRCGSVSVDTYDGTHWRYRAETSRMATVFVFRGHEHEPEKVDPTEVRIITAWRKRP